MLLGSTCPLCDRPGSAPCRRCRASFAAASRAPVPSGLDDCHALVDYVSAGRQLVTTLKYRNRRSALPWMGAALASLVAEPACQLVTWAPTSDRRARERGFDQAQLIAERVAAELDLPVARLLVRETGPHQTGSTRQQRLGRPAFRPVAVAPANLLLVDDVVTTGGTMVAACAALRAAGAEQVIGLAVARTPSTAQGAVPAGRQQS